MALGDGKPVPAGGGGQPELMPTCRPVPGTLVVQDTVGTSHSSAQSPGVSLPLQGVCPAGGCLIALSCDYRVLADNPKYCTGLNEVLLGIIAPFW